MLFGFLVPCLAIANGDTTNVPLNRQVFHDKIKAEQKKADKTDGKLDGIIKISSNDDVNLQVTDALIRRVNVLRNDVESNANLATNNEKIRYLRYIENLVKDFNINWKTRKISPTLAPVLVDNFSDIMRANMNGESMLPLIKDAPYEVGIINADIFKENSGYKESQKILFLKFCQLHQDNILANIGPYVN